MTFGRLTLYIPFWLYSNSVSKNNHCVAFNFTFHSGYIPIPRLIQKLIELIGFTFHSGYIPMIGKTTYRIITHYLYIPFWLYSNLMSRSLIQSLRSQLYIPFWLYSNGIDYSNTGDGKKLYIPFWLYSNGLWHDEALAWKHLYIPFWLYSNKKLKAVLLEENALYIPFWLYSNVTFVYNFKSPLFFTFHSGYIPINSYIREIKRFRPLHSILVIFQFL